MDLDLGQGPGSQKDNRKEGRDPPLEAVRGGDVQRQVSRHEGKGIEGGEGVDDSSDWQFKIRDSLPQIISMITSLTFGAVLNRARRSG